MLLNDLLGRKLSIMFSAVPSAIGYALMAGARGLWMLLLGRMLTGFAGGLTAACIPVRPDVPTALALFWATPASEPLFHESVWGPQDCPENLSSLHQSS